VTASFPLVLIDFADDESFSIMAAKVRGLRGSNITAKTRSLILQILESKADVACLVDTILKLSIRSTNYGTGGATSPTGETIPLALLF